MLRLFVVLFVLFFSLCYVRAIPPTSTVPSFQLTPLSGDAQAAALADLRLLSDHDQPYIRYLWIESSEVEDMKAVVLAINMVSRASTILRPVPIGNPGSLLLLRIDLRHYAPRENDLKQWLTIWEDFQFSPAFNMLLTKGTLKFAVLQFPDWEGKGWVVRWKQVWEKTDPYKDSRGKTLNQKQVWRRLQQVEEFKLVNLKDVELVRIPGPFLNYQIHEELCDKTGSQAPVVNSRYWLSRVLSAVKDKGIYATIYGGRYYELIGIDKGAKKGTDEDVLLEKLGIGNVEKGITAKKVFDNLRSDQRVGLFRSGVTGKSRRVDFFRSLAGRLDSTTSFVSVTHDLRDQDVDIDTHPMANLLEFKDAARETIWEQPNGLHGYALFNGEGARQDEVPPDIARDHTIPSPHSARLQPAISCISCHEADGSDGWKPVINDVKRMLGSRNGLDVFGDITKLNRPVADTLDRLAGLYQGDPERALVRGRDDYAMAVLKATGPWKEGKVAQTDVVKQAATRQVKIWRDYFYNMVDAQSALQELGIKASDKKAADVLLRFVLPPDRRATTNVPKVNQTIIPEDPRLGALRLGIPISRFDWDLCYGFAAERSQFHRIELIKRLPVSKK